MSLFKAYSNMTTARSLDKIREDFQVVFDRIAENQDTVTPVDVAEMTQLYAEYGATYMSLIAVSLQEPKGASETMKFMNSIIAEVVTKADLHYFDLERGFSIVDKAVQAALDNGGVPTMKSVMDIITEIEDSYKEEDVEDESTH